MELKRGGSDVLGAAQGAFMLLEFFDGALRGRGGRVRYAPEFLAFA